MFDLGYLFDNILLSNTSSLGIQILWQTFKPIESTKLIVMCSLMLILEFLLRLRGPSVINTKGTKKVISLTC